MNEETYKIKPGTRVGAILEVVDNNVKFLGYGTYDGDFTPPFFNKEEAEKTVRELFEDEDEISIQDLLSHMSVNPRITLDNGKIVWGAECWWTIESEIKKMLEGKNVEIIEISEPSEDSSVIEIEEQL